MLWCAVVGCSLIKKEKSLFRILSVTSVGILRDMLQLCMKIMFAHRVINLQSVIKIAYYQNNTVTTKVFEHILIY